jgi:hypothetical protein
VSARCWHRRRARARFNIALRKVTRDPWLIVPLTDEVSMVGIARWALLTSIKTADAVPPSTQA